MPGTLGGGGGSLDRKLQALMVADDVDHLSEHRELITHPPGDILHPIWYCFLAVQGLRAHCMFEFKRLTRVTAGPESSENHLSIRGGCGHVDEVRLERESSGNNLWRSWSRSSLSDTREATEILLGQQKAALEFSGGCQGLG